MERVIILGGNNKLGQIIARHLLNSGMLVTVFADGKDDLKISHHFYHYIQGDVYNIYSVSQAIAHHDVVISVYSAGELWRMFYLRDALQNIIKSMNAERISRFIFFSYSEMDHPFNAGKPAAPFFKKVLGSYYDRKIKTMFESSIRNSSLDFTINLPDISIIRKARKDPASGIMKEYYFFISTEIQKQVQYDIGSRKEIVLRFDGYPEMV